MQLYGRTFNLRAVLCHEGLGLDRATGLELASGLIHELGLLLRRRCGEPFHYAYLHQVRPGFGPTTTLIGHVDDDLADEVEEWVVDSLLPRKLGRRVDEGELRLRITRGPSRTQRVRRHWRLVRALCRNLDPMATEVVGGVPTPWTALLGHGRRFNEPLGALPLAQVGRVSETIGRSARERAAKHGLPLLSAVKDKAWGKLRSGWELAEHVESTGSDALTPRQRKLLGLN
jgi:hypothetical protein